MFFYYFLKSPWQNAKGSKQNVPMLGAFSPNKERNRDVPIWYDPDYWS